MSLVPPLDREQVADDLYTIARYVRMPGDRIGPFIAVLAMCGYEIVKRDDGERGQVLHEHREAGQGSEMPSSRAENEAASAGYRAPHQ